MPTKGKRERIGRLLQMHANHRKRSDARNTGDIAAAVGLKDTTTGDTLCDEKNPVVLEKMEFPEPVINVAIEPKTKAGQEKMSIALQRLAEEDPTFQASHRRGDRRDHHRRHGRAAPGDHRRPHAARVQGGSQLSASRRWPTRKPSAGRQRPRAAYPPNRRPRPVRPLRHHHRAHPAGQRLRVRQQDRRRRRSPGNTSRLSTRASRKRRHPVSSPAIPWWTSRSRLTDGSYHDVDSSEMAYKIAGPWPSRRPCRKARAGDA